MRANIDIESRPLVLKQSPDNEILAFLGKADVSMRLDQARNGTDEKVTQLRNTPHDVTDKLNQFFITSNVLHRLNNPDVAIAPEVAGTCTDKSTNHRAAFMEINMPSGPSKKNQIA